MAYLGNVVITTRDHTKSGYSDRKGFSDDSGWSNNGQMSSNLTSGESENILGRNLYNNAYTGLRVEALYGFQYGSSTQWEVVLKLKDSTSTIQIAKFPGFSCIVNAEEPDVILRLADLYDFSQSGYVSTYRWRGDIEKFLNNKSTGGGWQSGYNTEIVFTDSEPPSITEQIVDLDLGHQASDRGDTFNYVGADVTDVNFLSIRPRIKDAWIYSANTSNNPFQSYVEPNLGPTLQSKDGVKVFFNIGIPIAHGSDATGNYIEFNDWLWGTAFPSNQGYAQHMTSSIWEDLEITDKTGWTLNLKTLNSGTKGYLVTPQGASPANRYTKFRLYYTNTSGKNYSNPENGLFSRELFLEWPEGMTLHNRRFHANTTTFGNRFTVTDRNVAQGNHRIIDYEFPRGMILFKPLGAQRDSDYYKVVIGFQATASNAYSEMATVTFNGYAGELSTTTTAPSNYPLITGLTSPRKVSNLTPFGEPLVWRFRNPALVSPEEIETTTDGCTIEGHSAAAATGKESDSEGAIQHIVPNTQGERYRVQHTYTYSGGHKRIFTLEGRIIDTAKSNTIQLIQGSSQGQSTSGGNSGIALVGDEGLRLHFKIPWSGSSSDLDKITGQFVQLSYNINSVSGGRIVNEAGIIKRNATGSNFYHHDSAIFIPDGTSNTWSCEASFTIINNDIPYQRTHTGTWSGSWKPEYSVEILSPKGGTRLDRDTQPLRWAGSGNGTIANTITYTTTDTRQPSSGGYYYYDSAPNGTQVTGTDDYYWSVQTVSYTTDKIISIVWGDVFIYGPTAVPQYTAQYMTSKQVGNTMYYRNTATNSYSGGFQHYKVHRVTPITTTTESFANAQVSMPSFNYQTQHDYAWVQNETAGFVKISMDYNAGDHADVIKGDTDWTGPGPLHPSSVPYYLAAFKITGDD